MREQKQTGNERFSIAGSRAGLVRLMPGQGKVHENEVSRIDYAEPHPIFKVIQRYE